MQPISSNVGPQQRAQTVASKETTVSAGFHLEICSRGGIRREYKSKWSGGGGEVHVHVQCRIVLL